MLEENQNAPGLKGFIPGGNQSIVVVFSQRIGEEVPLRQIEALSKLSGLSIETVDQPMDTSSTGTREGKADEHLEGSALKLLAAFQVYGSRSDKNEARQAELVNGAVRFIEDREHTEKSVSEFKSIVAGLQGLNGHGFQLLDDAISAEMNKAKETLDNAPEDTKPLLAEKRVLISYREVLFELAYEIAKRVDLSVPDLLTENGSPNSADTRDQLQSQANKGGIDLNPQALEMETSNYGAFDFPAPTPQMVKNLNQAIGFAPKIIQITDY